MITNYFWPHAESLKPYFGMQSRIDSREKAFAFILGMLIGTLLHVRPHHDNITESQLFPLSQLFSISGADLHALYDKVMRALNNAPRNTRAKIEEVAEEARHLHASLPGLIDLEEDTTTYFVLYGISASASICYHLLKR